MLGLIISLKTGSLSVPGLLSVLANYEVGYSLTASIFH